MANSSAWNIAIFIKKRFIKKISDIYNKKKKKKPDELENVLYYEISK